MRKDSQSASGTEETTHRLSARGWLGLIVLMLGTFVVQVDFFIVNVALPSIQQDLNASLSALQLIAISYSGAFAVLVITGGRLGDLYGRRTMFITGLVGFAAASLLCGLAWSDWALVLGRVAQGLAAALVLPQAVGSIHTMFTGAARERAFAVFGVAMGGAWVGGIVIGGLIIGPEGSGLGWRWIFLVNLPLAAVAIIGALLFVDRSEPAKNVQLDLAGIAVLGAVIGLTVFPLIQGREEGWPWWTYAALGMAAVLAYAFVRIEQRVTATGRTPVLPLELFRDRNFRFGLLVIVVFFLGPPGFFLLTTLYLQSVLGFSAPAAGLSLLAFGIAFIFATELAKKLKQRMNEGVLLLGISAMVAGILVVAAVVEVSGTGLTIAHLAPGMALIGAGQALVTVPLYEMLLRHVPGTMAATASGVFTTIQIISQSLSVAFMVIVFTGVTDLRGQPAVEEGAESLAVQLREQGLAADETVIVIEDYRVCAHEGLAQVTAGVDVSCSGEGPRADAVDQAVSESVTPVVRQGYFASLIFYATVLLLSGATIVGTALRNRRQEQEEEEKVPES
ncbi:MFS transporter [Nocardiopsis valliformis]|uniref:MFS transporter n=1 Tax=Nocardiopsis valliformis TaxID=239974 RepID=UPI00034818ED|nr:MFS transporter [Nocardiopsis valliformis]